jgi:hypothetical protein
MLTFACNRVELKRRLRREETIKKQTRFSAERDSFNFR